MTDFPAIVETALSAAADKAFATIGVYGDKGDCGSAWVVVTERKGRKAIVAALGGIRTSKHHTGGLAVHILGGLHRETQVRAVFEDGCAAFVAVLEQNGIAAHVYSYAD